MDAELWPVNAATYHADRTRVSHSLLRVFMKSPRRYKAMIDGVLADEKTGPMLLGDAFHTMVLEPEHADRIVTAHGAGNRNANAYKSAVEKNPDGIVILPDEAERAMGMLKALREHPEARRLLFDEPGVSEVSVKWTEDPSGLKCKARFDRVLRDHPIVVDLKTAKSVEEHELASSAANFGYHTQASWYCRAFKELHGESPEFVFVSVCSEWPHEVVVWDLDITSRITAELRISRALQQLVECRESGQWMSRAERGVFCVSLPKWAQEEPTYG